jgi:hypothetical protein
MRILKCLYSPSRVPTENCYCVSDYVYWRVNDSICSGVMSVCTAHFRITFLQLALRGAFFD